MNHSRQITMLISITLVNSVYLYSQDSTKACKVELKDINETYAGECKNGFANGKGEAKGVHRYVGIFKNGLPNGKGIYYYNNSVYYTGNFQDGLKEGKGETHYLREGKPDSVVKGYWSGDVYRGNTYKTYNTTEMPFFDRVEITPSAESGNTLIIETSSTTGILDQNNGSGYVLTVTDVFAKDGSIISKLETPANPLKFSVSYRLTKFPVNLRITLSNGRAFNLELYKNANWTVKLFLNR
jgi:hypothetical protein